MDLDLLGLVFLSPDVHGSDKGGPPPGKIGTETITRGPISDVPKSPTKPLPKPQRPTTEIKKGK